MNLVNDKMLVDGELVDAASGETFTTLNPYSFEALASVPAGGAEDVDRAVMAARKAFDDGWWAWKPEERARIIRKLAELLDESAEHMAHVEVSDNGKIIREMRGMNQATGRWYRLAASLADTAEGTIPLGGTAMVEALNVREPWGVVGIQIPWNTPSVILAQGAAMALAAGNTIVVKPSEHAPCSTLEFARLTQEAGFPAGVVNVVSGFGPTVGAPLCSHEGVDRLVFTGSLEAGRIVAGLAAQRPIPVTLELGGKSANIVFEDADIDAAVEGVVAGIAGAAGQSCAAGSRALVHRSVYEQVRDSVVERLGALVLGDPAEMTTDIGPVCTELQLEKIKYYVDSALSSGATLCLGGTMPRGRPDLDGRWFFEPTVFDGVSNDMPVAREEIFGAVLVLIPFGDEAEAVSIANDSPFGLAAGIWTRDVGRALRVSSRLRAGTVWINQYRKGHPALPFGGFKSSGYGRVNGREGFQEMTQLKSVQIAQG
jgi:acyl-CoA reductase-like NAD-dependent aldehyde dehydrogenase